jgi:MYXO-CTERM domain-containing protein
MRMKFGIALLVAMFVAASGASAGTVPITIANPSFESCNVSTDAANSWIAWNAGCLATTSLFNQAFPNGSEVLWDNYETGIPDPGDDGFAYQVVTTIAANTTYTLTIDVGMQKSGDTSGAIVDLRAGTATTGAAPADGGIAGTTLLVGATAASPNGNVNPAAGYFNLWTLNYDSATTPGLVGQSLEIYLSSSTIQTDYDSVSLNATSDPPVANPEPAMFALVGAGLLGLVARRRFAK